MFLFKILVSVIGIGFSGAVKKNVVIKPRLLPIGDNQINYCNLLNDHTVSVLAGLGPAGCGKTHFACDAAVAALVRRDVDKIIITRPIVAVDEELGFLPGSIERKMDPWIKPVLDVLGEFYSKSEIRRFMDEGVVEIAPLAYMRGRTFRRAFLIADEIQNSSPNQMLMMLTRIGLGSKLVITGDLLQSDRAGLNGLADFYSRWKKSGKNVDGVSVVEFGIGDVQRSEVVSSVLRLYDNTNLNIEKDNEKKIHRPKEDNDAALIPKWMEPSGL
jgi:phosphate starvation-inducible PhoH-like protein